MQISKSNAFLNNSTQIRSMSEKSKTLSIISLNEFVITSNIDIYV